MRITRFLSGLSLSHISLQQIAALTSLSLVVTACGGGGGGSNNQSSSSSSSFSYSFSSASVSSNGTGVWPSVKVDAPVAKTLNFSWSAVEGASYYKLMKNQGGNSGFVQVGSNITGTSVTEEISVHLQDWINTRYIVQSCDTNDVCQDSNNTYTATEMLKSIGKVQASNADANDLFGWSVALSGDGQTLAVGAPAEDSNTRGVNGDQTSNNSRDSGAVYVFVKENGLWVQQAYLKASNTEQPGINTNRFLPNDRFGYRLAISDDGNTLAVSAINEDSPSWGVNCNQDNYERVTIVTSSSSSNSSSTSVSSTSSSVDTDEIYIAATELNIGAVYVFKRADTTWSQTAYIKPEYTIAHEFKSSDDLLFGNTLSMSGDGKTIAVGVSVDAFTFTENQNVIQFNRSSALACLNYDDLNPSSFNSSSTSSVSSRSSSSSSISSSSSSVRTYGGTQSGAVYTFVETESGWQVEAWIKPVINEQGDQFGTSVALSLDGNTLVVGAMGEDSKATGVNGDASDNSCFYLDTAAREYKFDAGCSKYGVANILQLDGGAAYVFTRNNGSWTQQAFLKPATSFLQTHFGSAVDISGDASTIAIGVTGDPSTINQIVNGASVEDKNSFNNPSAGAAYIFKHNGTSWAQEAFIKPEVNLPTYEFGNTVKLSADGSLLAVGSYRESSNAKGIDGNPGDISANSAGALFIFKRDNNIWSQNAYVKASDTEAQDRFGISAALSNDGKTLAVGAHRKSAQTSSASSQPSEAAGAVYIY
jgi:trimeric autotransporter adhesin